MNRNQDISKFERLKRFSNGKIIDNCSDIPSIQKEVIVKLLVESSSNF